MTAALGPSAAEAALPGAGALPPYSADAHPPEALVTVLLALAIVAGALGLLASWDALRRGWEPSPRRLLAASVLATAAVCAVPSIGSSDIVSYAAYGRMATTGHDPYATAPSILARAGDPVAVNVESWFNATSIYGPLATAEQALASTVGGRSLRTTVTMLVLLNAVGFAVTTVVLHAASRTAARRRRALFLWGLNPVLGFEIVAAGHVDAWTTACTLAAVLTVRRSAVVAGVLVGLAVDVKFSIGIIALAFVPLLWRQWWRLGGFVAAGGVAVVPVYAAAGPHVFDQARAASSFVSHANVWQPVALLLDQFGVPRGAVTTVAGLAAAALAVVLLRRWLGRLDATADTTTRAATAVAAVLAGYLLLTAYVLPWYDAPLWAMLALLPASRMDRLLLAHTSLLGVAYLPGNVAVPRATPVRVGQFIVQRIVAPPVLAATAILAAKSRAHEDPARPSAGGVVAKLLKHRSRPPYPE
ncbi:MAG: alpha,6-mannosyltransferase [Frankiaceae bacterium]|nr:alpha,6-mannosyltransferase [Frankiaceae bacterium]